MLLRGTGKGENWRTKPPDAESAVWGRFPESAGKAPHLSGARGGHALADQNLCFLTLRLLTRRFFMTHIGFHVSTQQRIYARLIPAPL